MADWVAPKGYELCGEGKCGVPARNGHDTDHLPFWQCKPDAGCKCEGCGCYVCVISPGSKQLRIDAKPGEKGSSRRMPPGWTMVCACMKEVAGEKESGWSVREDLKWIAPEGYKLADTCPQSCLMPQWDSSRSAWNCGSRDADSGERECFLVGVAPGEKQLHFLARPGSGFSDADVPPGWGIFCICLKKV